MSGPSPSNDLKQKAYQAPQYAPPAAAKSQFDPALVHELSARLRTFRGYCSALAVVLCGWGAISVFMGILTVSAVLNSDGPTGPALFLMTLLAINAIANFTFGIALFNRQVWAAWGVLVHTTLTLTGNLINENANVCLFVLVALFTAISIAIIVQAAKLRADGVSPQAKLVGGVIVS
ncbi:MAG TPA: hypothetical protein VGN57_19665 [Pirellulaceae bacterium]|jgi:hypothetical protein|nr:hypothetical protein [Pirellulaceae bacterium]